MRQRISNQIKSRRKELGLTQAKLAELVGVNHTAVSNWEHGRNTPEYGSLVKLANALQVEIGYFDFCHVHDPYPEYTEYFEKAFDAAKHLEKLSENPVYMDIVRKDAINRKNGSEVLTAIEDSKMTILNSVEEVRDFLYKNYRIDVEPTIVKDIERGKKRGAKLEVLTESKAGEVPLYGSVAAGISNGESARVESALERLPVTGDVLEVYPDAFAVRVKGDSMFPEVQEGDILLCTHDWGKVKTGDIVVAITPDGEFVKRVQVRVKGIELQSVNQFYPPLRVWENSDIQLVAVIELKRKYR